MFQLRVPLFIKGHPELTEFDKIVYEQTLIFQDYRNELCTKNPELFLAEVRKQMDRWACKVSNMRKEDITQEAIKKSEQKMERLHLMKKYYSNEDLYLKEDRLDHPLPQYQHDFD